MKLKGQNKKIVVWNASWWLCGSLNKKAESTLQKHGVYQGNLNFRIPTSSTSDYQDSSQDQMNPKVFLCALHEEYEHIPSWLIWKKSGISNKGSAEILTPQEAKWRDRYHFLLDRGFELRPRYRPGWIPSWLGMDLTEWDCEDGYGAVVSHVYCVYNIVLMYCKCCT